MAKGYNTVTVTTTATKILSAGNRYSAIVTVEGSTAVYVGFDSSVTTSNGVRLGQYDVWRTYGDRPYQGDLYGIVSSGTSDVRWEDVG